MLFRSKTRARRGLATLTLLILLTIIYATHTGAQLVNRPTDAKGWSDLVFARYQKVQTMRAQFEQTITHKESGIDEQRAGELFFQKPFFVRWESRPPFDELIVVDKENLWQYFPEEELALKFRAADVDDQSEFLAVLTGRAPLMDKFRITPQQEVEGVFSLKLMPFSPSMSLVEATIWVDMESGLILRLSYTDFYGNVNDIAFVNQELDVRLPDEVFSLRLPPDTAVEDHTK